jgi:integrase
MSSVRRDKEGKLFFDFRYLGIRCREYTRLVDNPKNKKIMQSALEKIEAEITLGVFSYEATFPNSKRLQQFKEMNLTTSTYNSHIKESLPDFKTFSLQWFKEQEVLWKNSYREKLDNILHHHLLPRFGTELVHQIQKADLLSFRVELSNHKKKNNDGLSPSRINQILNLMKQIINEAADRYDFVTPYRGIKPIKLSHNKIEPFSLEEVHTFLNNVDPYWKNYFLVRFFTGMRTSEIDGLKWEYVDLNRHEILIEEALVYGEVTTPKTPESHRIIQMSKFVYDALVAQKEIAGKQKNVFTSSQGELIHYRNLNNRIWYPTLKKCGLKHRRPYQTRHTAATLWLASGENPEWIAKQMGHSNTKMLFTIYSRYVPNLTRKDGSAFENMMGQFFQYQ